MRRVTQCVNGNYSQEGWWELESDNLGQNWEVLQKVEKGLEATEAREPIWSHENLLP